MSPNGNWFLKLSATNLAASLRFMIGVTERVRQHNDKVKMYLTKVYKTNSRLVISNVG